MSTKAKLAAVIPVIAFIVVPAIFAVASAASLPPNEQIWNPTILKGPLVTCTGLGGPGNIPACQNLCDMVSTFTNVVYFGIGVVIWILVPIFVAWGGVQLLISRGNPAGISTGKKIITGTVIGLIIVLAAYLIVLTFVSVMGITGIGGFGSSTCSVAGSGGTTQTQTQTQNSGTNTNSGGQVGATCLPNVVSCPSPLKCCLSLGFGGGSYTCQVSCP